MNRFDKIIGMLDAYGLDALLVTSEPNRLYVTGFPSSAGTAVVTKEGCCFLTDSRYIEAAAREITGCEVAEPTRANPTLQMVEDFLRRRQVRRLGFEEDRTTVSEYETLRSKLTCELVPAAALLAEARAVKDPGEVEAMIDAQRIAEKALDEVLPFIKAGRTEKEIAAFLQYRMLLGGAELMSFDPIVVSGPNTSLPHGVPTERVVSDGDFLTMDFGCVYHGYCSDMTRTVAIGHVTEEMDKVYHTVLEAQLAGIAQARAGVLGKTIHNAAAQVIANAGYDGYFRHGFGHSLGIEVHEMPGAGPYTETPLPAGTVLSAEPGIYLPGRFGVRIEDVIVIEENGCRNITKAPKELLIL